MKSWRHSMLCRSLDAENSGVSSGNYQTPYEKLIWPIGTSTRRTAYRRNGLQQQAARMSDTEAASQSGKLETDLRLRLMPH